MSDKQKAPFNKLSEADKVRHQNEMKEFKETGFFTNKDGVNSKTLPKVMTKQKVQKKAVDPTPK